MSETREVPVEPTVEMCAEGTQYLGVTPSSATPKTAKRVYEAMLAAAPQPIAAFSSPCCGKYAVCKRPCTPRGEWIAEQRIIRALDEIINAGSIGQARRIAIQVKGDMNAAAKRRE